MAGDGIDDAQVTRVEGDLRGILRALDRSEAAMRTMRQNLGLARVDDPRIPVAAGALSPALQVRPEPAMAARDAARCRWDAAVEPGTKSRPR